LLLACADRSARVFRTSRSPNIVAAIALRSGWNVPFKLPLVFMILNTCTWHSLTRLVRSAVGSSAAFTAMSSDLILVLRRIASGANLAHFSYLANSSAFFSSLARFLAFASFTYCRIIGSLPLLLFSSIF